MGSVSLRLLRSLSLAQSRRSSYTACENRAARSLPASLAHRTGALRSVQREAPKASFSLPWHFASFTRGAIKSSSLRTSQESSNVNQVNIKMVREQGR